MSQSRQTISLAADSAPTITAVGPDGSPTAALGCAVEDETVASARIEMAQVVLLGRRAGVTTLTVETVVGRYVAELHVSDAGANEKE